MAGDPDTGSPSPSSSPGTGAPAPASGPARPEERARLVRWRRRTTAVFWGLAAVFSITSSVQVGVQLFAPEPPSDPSPSCAEGLDRLRTSLDAGWAAARREDDTPERALARFRGEVGPTWRHLPALQRACQADPARSARLDALERLRYALEARVRVDGGSLAALRRRALGDASTAGATGDPTAPPSGPCSTGPCAPGEGADEEGPEPRPPAR